MNPSNVFIDLQNDLERYYLIQFNVFLIPEAFFKKKKTDSGWNNGAF